MKFIQVLRTSPLALMVLFVASCGGGSSSDPSDSPNFQAPTNTDKYDINAYSPTTETEENLTGTWLYVMKFNINYRVNSFHDEDEYRHYILEHRSLINLIETDDEIQVFQPLEYGYSGPTGYAFRSGNELILELDYGEFAGTIENNNKVIGEIRDYSDGLSPYSSRYALEMTVNSSSAGMVKLLSKTSIPGIGDEVPTWGVIDFSEEASSLPIHGMYEEHMIWRIIEGGAVTGSDEIYEFVASSILEESTELPAYLDSYSFRFQENIAVEIYEEDEPGWIAQASEQINGNGNMRMAYFELPTPLVTTSSLHEIIGSFSSSEAAEETLDITLQLD